MNMSEKILVSLCCIFIGVFCASGAENIKKTMKMSVFTKYPPQAKTSGTSGSNLTGVKDQWLDIELKYRPQDIKDVKKRFIDDVELNVRVLCRDAKRTVLFNGSVKYWYIERDGKDHYMKALLPAPIFRRYISDQNIDRFKLYVAADIVVGGKVIATAYGSNKAVPLKDISAAFRNLPKNTVKVEGAVSGRTGTTWSIIEVNKYEYEKVK